MTYAEEECKNVQDELPKCVERLEKARGNERVGVMARAPQTFGHTVDFGFK